MENIIKDTQIFILCGGRGERMRPLTDYCCKPMLSVQGKPILQWQIEHLLSLGFKKENILLLAGYRADDIVYNPEINVSCIIESKPLGTAGAIKNIEYRITSDNFFVLYGDVISFEDHRETLKFHLQKEATATIKYHLREVNSEIKIDSDNSILEFTEHSKIKTNSDIYCFNRSILSRIPKDTYCDFPNNVFPKLLRAEFYALPIQKYRIAIDTIERLEKANADMVGYIQGRVDVRFN